MDLVYTLDHDSVVCCVKFSMDGRFLAAGCNQATYIYDTMTSTRVAQVFYRNRERRKEMLTCHL